jgi:hypothetical protein
MITKQKTNRRARVDDWIEVDIPGGGPSRRGLILDVLGGPGHEHYRVRWDESHESLFYPSSHARFVRAHTTRAQS